MQIADHCPGPQSTARTVSDAELARAGLTAFFAIAGEWGLNTTQQRLLLGNPARTTFFQWKKQQRGRLSKDTLDRLSYLIGIYKALQLLFSDRSALAWLHHPNRDPLFGGRSPLDFMLNGDLPTLAQVRRYLDWARG